MLERKRAHHARCPRTGAAARKASGPDHRERLLSSSPSSRGQATHQAGDEDEK